MIIIMIMINIIILYFLKWKLFSCKSLLFGFNNFVVVMITD